MGREKLLIRFLIPFLETQFLRVSLLWSYNFIAQRLLRRHIADGLEWQKNKNQLRPYVSSPTKLMYSFESKAKILLAFKEQTDRLRSNRRTYSSIATTPEQRRTAN